MAARAGAVLPLGLRRGRASRRSGADAQERSARRERGHAARIVDVLAPAPVAGLATDPHLDEVLGLEPGARLQHGPAQGRARRFGGPLRGTRGGIVPRPQRPELPIQRRGEHACVADAVVEARAHGQQLVDDLALIRGRCRTVQRAPQIVEVRNGVVAEDTGLVPDPTRPHSRPLAHHHRVAFQPERSRLKDV
jgi:hypothetical protein